jgi:hypothetical protein
LPARGVVLFEQYRVSQSDALEAPKHLFDSFQTIRPCGHAARSSNSQEFVGRILGR